MEVQLFQKLNKKLDDIRSELWKHEPAKEWIAGVKYQTGDYRVRYFYTEEEAKDFINAYTDNGRFNLSSFVAHKV